MSLWRPTSAVQVMESLESAKRRGATIIAEYLGGAVTCDAHHMTDPREDGLGVSTCIENALAEAGVAPEEVCQWCTLGGGARAMPSSGVQGCLQILPLACLARCAQRC